jgi:hypothetical protein
MNISEYAPADIQAAASVVTPSGIAPGAVLTDDTADIILAYCQTVSTSAQWAAAEVGLWKRKQLKRLYGAGTATYNERVSELYEELSRYCPTVASATSWRSYLSAAESVPYDMRVIGYGPSVYIPLLSYPPHVFATFTQAVIDGHHTDFQRQLFQRNGNGTNGDSTNGDSRATHIARMEEQDIDDVPFSGSGHNYANGNGAVTEYEQSRAIDDLPVLTWETLAQVRRLRDCVLCGDFESATAAARALEWM